MSTIDERVILVGDNLCFSRKEKLVIDKSFAETNTVLVVDYVYVILSLIFSL